MLSIGRNVNDLNSLSEMFTEFYATKNIFPRWIFLTGSFVFSIYIILKTNETSFLELM